MTNPVPVLSDDEVTEIEAMESKSFWEFGGDFEGEYVPLSAALRDALCATVRALRTERLEIQRVLASAVLEDPTEDDQPPYSTTELVEGVRWLLRMKEMKQERNTALREQLAAAESARDQLSAALSVRDAQLAQVTQERDRLLDAMNVAHDRSNHDSLQP